MEKNIMMNLNFIYISTANRKSKFFVATPLFSIESSAIMLLSSQECVMYTAILSTAYLDPYYIGTYYTEWVKTSWTGSTAGTLNRTEVYLP